MLIFDFLEKYLHQILCMIVEEKCFPCYALLTAEI